VISTRFRVADHCTVLLSILIVNWRSKDYLRQCLRTVGATCANLKPQIVVVDGGSFDGCAEMLRNEFQHVEFVQSEQNIGFGRCNNLGFEKVTGEVVLLLNPDTELKSQAVEGLLRQLMEAPEAGMVGARLVNSDGSLQTSCVQSLPTPLNQALDSEFLRRLFPNSRLWGISALWQSSPAEVEAISGACMLMRSETYRRVGGFGSQYFMYGEDIDLCAKVRKAGLKIYYEPRAEVIHHGGGSSRKQFSKFSVVLTRVAVVSYLKSHHSLLGVWSYRALMALSALLRIMTLLSLSLLPFKNCEANHLDSLQKWIAILKWSFGGERWAKSYAPHYQQI
jgi:GT2 family glycosyltransferase